MESHFGLTWREWYNQYEEEEMDIFKDKNLTDPNILMLLGRCCVGFEMITPTLKKANWNIERFIQAEIDYGIELEGLGLMVGEYLTIEDMDYKNMEPEKIREKLGSDYTIKDLTARGKIALQDYKITLLTKIKKNFTI